MICFTWRGFPQYAARCIADFVKKGREEVVVVGVRPSVPIEGMEKLVGCPVKWVGLDDHTSFDALGLDVPRVMFMSGWETTPFNDLYAEVKANGGKVVLINDANYQLSLKELLRALRFRLFQRKRFDGFLVPGKSGVKLMRLYGVPMNRVATGLYSADETLFKDGAPIMAREKRIVYVGQFIPRKNVLPLCRAFVASKGAERGWTIALYGSGEQKSALEQFAAESPGIEVHPFVQPEQLAAIYQSARVFALPSLEEHWGLVVHEGALSGCLLYLSDCIGAADDLLSKTNGVTFDPRSVESMAAQLSGIYEMSDDQWSAAHDESILLAGKIGVSSFSEGVERLLEVV